jgi:hypothetical protein
MLMRVTRTSEISTVIFPQQLSLGYGTITQIDFLLQRDGIFPFYRCKDNGNKPLRDCQHDKVAALPCKTDQPLKPFELSPIPSRFAGMRVCPAFIEGWGQSIVDSR